MELTVQSTVFVVVPWAIYKVLHIAENDHDPKANLARNGLTDVLEGQRDSDVERVNSYLLGDVPQIAENASVDNLYPWPIGSFKLLLHRLKLALGVVGLSSYLTESPVSIPASQEHRNQADHFKTESYRVPSVVSLVSVFDFVIVGYGWWNANRNLKIGLGSWFLVIALGSVLLIYGFNTPTEI